MNAAPCRCRPISRRGGAPDDRDRVDYQTMFALTEGSVAAPTAGLHFTDALIARLRERQIALHKVTLHVGAGTFLPVKAADTAAHRMHGEHGSVSAQTADALNAVRRAGGRIVAVGSTALRLLESASADDGVIRPFTGETALFITPGYRFRAVDVMMTNFHLPRSTLFMLVAAFAGLDVMKRAYAHAIEAGYRFYSYGDACLLFREPVLISPTERQCPLPFPSASPPPTVPRAAARSRRRMGRSRRRRSCRSAPRRP